MKRKNDLHAQLYQVNKSLRLVYKWNGKKPRSYVISEINRLKAKKQELIEQIEKLK